MFAWVHTARIDGFDVGLVRGGVPAVAFVVRAPATAAFAAVPAALAVVSVVFAAAPVVTAGSAAALVKEFVAAAAAEGYFELASVLLLLSFHHFLQLTGKEKTTRSTNLPC